jgi:hypothetical protein
MIYVPRSSGFFKFAFAGASGRPFATTRTCNAVLVERSQDSKQVVAHEDFQGLKDKRDKIIQAIDLANIFAF